MKNIVKILLGFIVAVICYSCEDTEQIAFYARQEHDPNLIGWWLDTTKYEYWQYHSNGKLYSITILQDGSLSRKGGGVPWYTKDSVIYELKVGIMPFNDSHERSMPYSLSEDNTNLCIEQHRYYIRVEQP